MNLTSMGRHAGRVRTDGCSACLDMDHGAQDDLTNWWLPYVDGATHYVVKYVADHWELQYSDGHAILKFDGAGASTVTAGGHAVEFPVSQLGALGIPVVDPRDGSAKSSVGVAL